MDKATIKSVNETLKNITENKVYTLDILENYRVLKLKENAVKALQDYGFTELKANYISSRKYGETVLDILIQALKENGFTQKA